MISRFFVALLRMWANHTLFPSLRHFLFRLSGLQFGEGAFINLGLHIIDNYENLVEIGERVAVAPNVTLVASSNANNSVLNQLPRYNKKEKLYIGDDSWLGTGAVIMPGIRVGKRCIVGANTVVTKNIPDDTIAFGNPMQLKPVAR